MAQWAATAPAIHCLCIVSFQERWNVDVIVTEIPNENSWGLTDQLGRDMGRITLSRPGTFMIRTAGNAMQGPGCRRVEALRFARHCSGRDRGAHRWHVSTRAQVDHHADELAVPIFSPAPSSWRSIFYHSLLSG